MIDALGRPQRRGHVLDRPSPTEIRAAADRPPRRPPTPARGGRPLGIAFGVWGAVNGAAAAAGPIVGGLLTEAISWRWVFFVNIPISVGAVLPDARAWSRRAGRTREVRIDVPGIVTFTAAASRRRRSP